MTKKYKLLWKIKQNKNYTSSLKKLWMYIHGYVVQATLHCQCDLTQNKKKHSKRAREGFPNKHILN